MSVSSPTTATRVLRLSLVSLLLFTPWQVAQSQTQLQAQQQAQSQIGEETIKQQVKGQPMSDGERRMRIMLLQRSMGFGGIFGPLIAPLNRPGAPRSAPTQKSCGSYSDNAACQAMRNGDRWAADRLQNKRSTPAERDWYNR